jgi:hypothetical protein
MMKVKINKARMHVTARVRQEGSVLGQTIRGSWPGIETRLEGVIRNAENGCFVMQALLNPVPIQRTVFVNGTTFDPEAFQRAGR